VKANPAGALSGQAILGRQREIAHLRRELEKKSVLLTAERRVGKTCVLRKMAENPSIGWTPILCWVESVRHPIECVERIYAEANALHVRSPKGVWLGRVKSAYQAIAGTQVAGWKLPPIRSEWKRLLHDLISDIAENTGNRVVVMIDEFPQMVSNIVDDHGGAAGREFLDTLREIRQEFEPSGRIRFLLSGSIGLHLIVQHLKAEHGYKGNPTNDMAIERLSGMTIEDVQLMCRKYLDEEGIRRDCPGEFDERMLQLTDGLPIYIQYVCERFQESKRQQVSPDDVDVELRAMMDNREIEWFRNAAERIETYYKRLGANRRASAILKMLSGEEDFVPEEAVLDYVRSQMIVEDDDQVRSTLEILLDDNYLLCDTSTGRRRYRFRYGIMRWWWKINRG